MGTSGAPKVNSRNSGCGSFSFLHFVLFFVCFLFNLLFFLFVLFFFVVSFFFFLCSFFIIEKISNASLLFFCISSFVLGVGICYFYDCYNFFFFVLGVGCWLGCRVDGCWDGCVLGLGWILGWVVRCCVGSWERWVLGRLVLGVGLGLNLFKLVGINLFFFQYKSFFKKIGNVHFC